MPLLAGLSMTHAFLPPHPGPVAAAGLLHVDLGWVILMGVVCGIPAVLAAWVYAAWIGKRHLRRRPAGHGRGRRGGQGRGRRRAARRRASTPHEAPVAARHRPRHHRHAAGPDPRRDVLLHRPGPLHACRSVIEFFGHPFVALTIALLLAYYLLGIRRGWSRKSLETVSTASLKPVGNILLVVGAGGVFGAVLKGSGVAQALSDTFNDVGLPVIVLAYLISARPARRPGLGDGRDRHDGGHRRPAAVEGGPLAGHLALVIMAISAGSIFASHVNDGGFWIVVKYFGISERDTLKSWTVLESVLSVAGFAVAAAGEPGRVGRVRTWPRAVPWSRGSLFAPGPAIGWNATVRFWGRRWGLVGERLLRQECTASPPCESSAGDSVKERKPPTMKRPLVGTLTATLFGAPPSRDCHRRGFAVALRPSARQRPQPAKPAKQPKPPAPDFAGTVALSNCSGSLVRMPELKGRATRLWCSPTGTAWKRACPEPGQVIVDQAVQRNFTLLDAYGGDAGHADVHQDRVRDDDRHRRLAVRTGLHLRGDQEGDGHRPARRRGGQHPTQGTAITVVSGYWKETYSCTIDGFVPELREDGWTMKDSLRYTNECETKGGTSGSPVIDDASGKVVGVNNTRNEDGEECTLNNPLRGGRERQGHRPRRHRVRPADPHPHQLRRRGQQGRSEPAGLQAAQAVSPWGDRCHGCGGARHRTAAASRGERLAAQRRAATPPDRGRSGGVVCVRGGGGATPPQSPATACASTCGPTVPDQALPVAASQLVDQVIAPRRPG